MKDPAFLFYSSDFLTGTMFMTDEQVGKYIRLMCAQHQKGRLTEKDMLHICKSYDEDIFSKFNKDQDGKFYSERLEAEIEKRKKYSESRRNNRLKPKKDNNTSLSYDNHMSIHMENEIENENKDEKRKSKSAFQPDFDSLPSWMVEPLKIWFNYKKEKNSKYLPVGWDALIRKVQKEFTNEAELMEAVNNSMSNNWQGIFKSKKADTLPLTDNLPPMDYTTTF